MSIIEIRVETAYQAKTDTSYDRIDTCPNLALSCAVIMPCNSALYHRGIKLVALISVVFYMYAQPKFLRFSVLRKVF